MATRFQRHPTAPPTVALAARAGAILLALLTAALLLTIAGAHPLELGWGCW